MNNYETVFILTPVLSDAQMKEAVRFLTFRQDKYAAEYAAKRRNLKSSKETVKENN